MSDKMNGQKINRKLAAFSFCITCGVHTARFLKHFWPFYNIMHERVNPFQPTIAFHIEPNRCK